jgi:fused signal recognition particle receptor
VSSTAAILVFVGILALATFLILLPRIVGRREARHREERAARPTRPAPVDVEDAPSVTFDDDVVVEEVVVDEALVEEIEAIEVEVVEAPRLRDRLGKTRATFSGLVGTFRRGGTINDESWDELEETLLLADVGLPTTARLLDSVRERVRSERISDPNALIGALRAELVELLAESGDRTLTTLVGEPNVWMFVGVNGVGKTTTIAKVAQHESEDGHRIVLAAADTFRAAAAEQLALWADRVGAELVRGQEGADPGSVVFDAMSAATGRGADLVLVDTAGRLHTKVNLMNELEKLRRIVERTPGALKEVLLVLDATTGQNGLAQAREFAGAVDVTGVVLTKLDGTAKGGIVLAIEAELGIPVKLVGVGESAEDLLPFVPEQFVDALLE